MSDLGTIGRMAKQIRKGKYDDNTDVILEWVASLSREMVVDIQISYSPKSPVVPQERPPYPDVIVVSFGIRKLTDNWWYKWTGSGRR